VDKIRDAAHRILVESEELKRLLGNLRYEVPHLQASKEERSRETACWEKMGASHLGGFASHQRRI
jgi:hypothetical protein